MRPGRFRILEALVVTTFLHVGFAVAADVNLDGETNVADVACVVAISLGNADACGPNGAMIADWNCDTSVDVQDVIAVVQSALDAMNGPSSWSNGQGQFPACSSHCDSSCSGYHGCGYRFCAGEADSTCTEFPLKQGIACQLDLSCEHVAECHDLICRLTAIQPTPDCVEVSPTCEAVVGANDVLACPAGIVFALGSQEHPTGMSASLSGEPQGSLEYLGVVFQSVDTSSGQVGKWVTILDSPPTYYGFIQSGHVFMSVPWPPVGPPPFEGVLGGFVIGTPIWAPPPVSTTLPYTPLDSCVMVTGSLVKSLDDWLNTATLHPYVTFLFRNTSGLEQSVTATFGQLVMTSKDGCNPFLETRGLSNLVAGCIPWVSYNCSTSP